MSIIEHTRTIVARKRDERRRNTPAAFRTPKVVHPIQSLGGFLLVLIAVAILVFVAYKDLVIGATHTNSVHAWMLLFAVVIGFPGYYILNPQRARDGLVTMGDVSTSLIIAWREGRRKTDVRMIEVKKDDEQGGAP